MLRASRRDEFLLWLHFSIHRDSLNTLLSLFPLMKLFALLASLIPSALASNQVPCPTTSTPLPTSAEPVCPDSALQVVLKQREITINNDNRLSATMELKMNQAPSQNVRVFLGAPTLHLSNCSLVRSSSPRKTTTSGKLSQSILRRSFHRPRQMPHDLQKMFLSASS